jgi:hypothetical protein
LIPTGGGGSSNALVVFVKPVVEEYAAFLSEEHFALFLNAHGQVFGLADLQSVRFGQRLIEQAHAAFDFLPVDPDVQLAEQLIEIEFDEVAFSFSDFQAEFHSVSLRSTQQKRCHATDDDTGASSSCPQHGFPPTKAGAFRQRGNNCIPASNWDKGARELTDRLRNCQSRRNRGK